MKSYPFNFGVAQEATFLQFLHKFVAFNAIELVFDKKIVPEFFLKRNKRGIERMILLIKLFECKSKTKLIPIFSDLAEREPQLDQKCRIHIRF